MTAEIKPNKQNPYCCDIPVKLHCMVGYTGLIMYYCRCQKCKKNTQGFARSSIYSAQQLYFNRIIVDNLFIFPDDYPSN
jgi:hypothetical protein